MRKILLRSFGPYGGGGEPGTLHTPCGLDVFDGEAYIADRGTNSVQVFSVAGEYQRSWGTQGNGNGQFYYPSDVRAIDGEVFVVDQTGRCQVFDTDGNFLRAWAANTAGWCSLDVYGDEVTVTSRNTYYVKSYLRDGTFVRQWTIYSIGQVPYCIHYYNDEIYVGAEEYPNKIMSVHSLAGARKRGWATGGFSAPYPVAAHNDGDEILVQYDSNIIQAWSPTGTALDSLTIPGSFYIRYGLCVAGGEMFVGRYSSTGDQILVYGVKQALCVQAVRAMLGLLITAAVVEGALTCYRYDGETPETIMGQTVIEESGAEWCALVRRRCNILDLVYAMDDGTIRYRHSRNQGETWSMATIIATGYKFPAAALDEQRGMLPVMMWKDSNWYLTVGTLGDDGITWSWSTPTVVASGGEGAGELRRRDDGTWEFIHVDGSGQVKILRCKALAADGTGVWA